jgi:PKD repeat protein
MKKSIYLLSSILLLAGCAKAPDACFNFSPSTIKVGDIVTFNADCSKNASYFEWSFGDNTQDTIINGTKTVTHIYKTPGTFEVKLITSRKDGVTLRKGNPEKRVTIIVQ